MEELKQRILEKDPDDYHSNIYYVVDTNKEFELKSEESFVLTFNDPKLMVSIKERYKNHKYFLSVAQINTKLKSGFFSKNNWDYLKKNYPFQLAVDNNFKLIEYSKNEFNFNNIEEFENINMDDIKRRHTRVWFGVGNELEGFVFTYSSYFCLNKNGKVENGVLGALGYPTNTFNEIRFFDKEIQFIFEDCISIARSQYIEWENRIIEKINKSEKNLLNSKLNIISQFDKDNNGIIDIIEDKNEFNQLFKKHQNIVIEKGKEFNQNYTHQFIKVGNYLKEKRSNLQLIFEHIKNVENEEEFNEYASILENDIHLYNLLLINSLSLLVSLIEDDQITFYDIYERFDKLNIFNSNWENEVSNKLTDVNFNLQKIMFEIRDMGNKIVKSIEDLTFITSESIRILDSRLGEIDSSIKTNNLLTLINTYQTYKVNKNTKGLRD
jgi:hypothetical protein